MGYELELLATYNSSSMIIISLKKCCPAYLTRITIPSGLPDATKPEPDQLELSKHDHAGTSLENETSAVASIETLPFVDASPLLGSSPQVKSSNGTTQVQKVHVTGGGMDPCLASHEMNTALQQQPDDDVIAYV
jgi:hypothetical protein